MKLPHWGKNALDRRIRVRTLQRSHAWPVRFESASLRFTEVEKSVPAVVVVTLRGCGGLFRCSMRWILWES